MTNPRVAELGAGPRGKGCRTCKLVRSEQVDAPPGALWHRHACTVTDSPFVIDLAFVACAAYEPVFALPEHESAPPSPARDRAKAAFKEKIANKPTPPIEFFS